MVSIHISWPLALALAALGAAWIYLDGRERGMDTADMWAVGFVIGMFVPPIVGAVAVGVLYTQKRPGGGRGRNGSPGYRR
jgi:cytochrome bd-type quinol oxidase subunit 2